MEPLKKNKLRVSFNIERIFAILLLLPSLFMVALFILVQFTKIYQLNFNIDEETPLFDSNMNPIRNLFIEWLNYNLDFITNANGNNAGVLFGLMAIAGVCLLKKRVD